MAQDTFQHPIHLYGDVITVEDWLVNFTIDTNREEIERYPNENIAFTVADATFLPTKLGDMEITRDQLVALFTEEAVLKEEFDAGLAYLNNNTL